MTARIASEKRSLSSFQGAYDQARLREQAFGDFERLSPFIS